ncbi:MAG TPA: alpha-xylosidase [Euzebyales bacterium]|nr:alpha-xylosidase [Euzebyales bacterium]
MKFSDGYWRVRGDVRLRRPAEAHDVQATPDVLTVHAPTRRIAQRGDTLNTPLLTFELWSPAPDVVGVRMRRRTGAPDRHPAFTLRPDPAVDARATVDDDGVGVLTSGGLTVRCGTGAPWRLEFRAGDRVLTSSEARLTGFAELPDGSHRMLAQLALGVDELVYGLGERFGPFVKNGQVVDIWNADGGTSSWKAYKNVPFYLTSRGYGVFVNHPGAVSFEVGSETVSQVQFSVEDQALEYFVIHGPTPKEILRRYTALTGRPALPPAWSFGLWLTTSFTTSYDEETVTSFVAGMAERDIPMRVFHFDCFWMREFNWCDFEWDRRVFPDPEAMLARLAERGLAICVWINPYIAQRSPLFAEGAERGYLVRRADGTVWQTDDWQAGMGIVDFTNPEACEWYAGKLHALLDMGVDCFKADFGEKIPTDVAWHDGSDPQRMHNYYSYLYNRTVFEATRAHRGDGDALVFARSATAGGQQFPVHGGGDSTTSLVSMAETLRGGLSLGLSGFGFWSHDIGGFDGTPTSAVFKRWIPFGLLSSHSRLHGNESYRVPWAFDDEAVDVLRTYSRLKARLMPYLYGAAVEARDDGVPVLRAMVLEFPDDPACLHLDRQYLLGGRLLVAPVFSDDGEVSYYVPAGRWTHLRTGEVVEGPAWRRERHGYGSLPLLVRPNTVLPVGAEHDRPDYDHTTGVTLQVYAPDDGAVASARIPAGDGTAAATFTVTRSAGTVEVTRDGLAPGWRVLLVGVDAGTISTVDGGTVGGAVADIDGMAGGALITPDDDAATVRITRADRS